MSKKRSSTSSSSLSVIISEEFALDDTGQYKGNEDHNMDDVYSDTFDSESEDDRVITEAYQQHAYLPRDDDTLPTPDTESKHLYAKYGPLHRSPYSDEEETPLPESTPDTVRFGDITASVRLSNYLVSPPSAPIVSHSPGANAFETTRVPYSDEEDSSSNESPSHCNRDMTQSGERGMLIDDTWSGRRMKSSSSNDSLEVSNDTHEPIVATLSASDSLHLETTPSHKGPYSGRDENVGIGGVAISSTHCASGVTPCEMETPSTSATVSTGGYNPSPLSVEKQWNAMMAGGVGDTSPYASPMGPSWPTVATASGYTRMTCFSPPDMGPTDRSNDDSGSVHSADPGLQSTNQASMEGEGMSRSISEPTLQAAMFSAPLPRPTFASPSPTQLMQRRTHSPALTAQGAMSPYARGSPTSDGGSGSEKVLKSSTFKDRRALHVHTQKLSESSSDSNDFDTPLARPPRARTTSTGDQSTLSLDMTPRFAADRSPVVSLFQSPGGKSPGSISLHRTALVKAAQSTNKGGVAALSSPLASHYVTPPTSARHKHSTFFSPDGDSPSFQLHMQQRHQQQEQQQTSPTPGMYGQLTNDDNAFLTAASSDTSPLFSYLPYPWVEYVSEEGWPYFYNEITGESSWERPVTGENEGAAAEHGYDTVLSDNGDELRGTTGGAGDNFPDYSMMDDASQQWDEAVYDESRYDEYTVPQPEDEQADPAGGNHVQGEGSSRYDESLNALEVTHPTPQTADRIDLEGGNVDDDSSRLSPCTSSDGEIPSGDNVSVQSTLSISRSSVFDVKNKSGQSVLHISASSGNVDALALLLSTGADVNGIDGNGMSPLQIICNLKPSAAQTACISLLVQHGADVNRVDEYGNTGLHNIILWGVGGQLLSQLDQEVSNNVLKNMPRSELDELRAAQLSSLEVLTSHRGMDTAIANTDGDQPLHIATKLGLVSCMQVLLMRFASNSANSPSHAVASNKTHSKSSKRSNSTNMLEAGDGNHPPRYSRNHHITSQKISPRQKEHISDSNRAPQQVDSSARRQVDSARRSSQDHMRTSGGSSTLSAVPSIAQSVNYYSTSEDERNALATSQSRGRHSKHHKNSPRSHTSSKKEHHASSVKSSHSAHSSSTGNRSMNSLKIDTVPPAVDDDIRHYYDISDDSSGDDKPIRSSHHLKQQCEQNVDDRLSGSAMNPDVDGLIIRTATLEKGKADIGQEHSHEYVIEEYAHLGVLRDSWIEYCTEEGDKYYYNCDTGHVQWMHPYQAELDKRAAIIARLPPMQKAVAVVFPVDITGTVDDAEEVEEILTDEQYDSGQEGTEKVESISIGERTTSPAENGDENIKNKLREKYKQYTSSLSLSSNSIGRTDKSRSHGMRTSNVEAPSSKSNTVGHGPTRTSPEQYTPRVGGTSMRTMSVTVGSDDLPRSGGAMKPATNTATSYYQYSNLKTITGSNCETGLSTPSMRQGSTRGQLKERSSTRQSSPDEVVSHTQPTGTNQFLTPSKKNNPTSVRGNLSRNPSLSSLSGESEASKERHLEVWSRFFENAMIASHSREEAEVIRQKANRKGVSVGGFTPVFVRKKSGLKDAWNLPPATAEYEATVNRAIAMKKNEDTTKGHHDMSAQEERISADGNWAVLAAAMRGDLSTAEILLLHGFNPSCVDDHIRTPLHYACRAGDTAMVALLNDYGSDIDATDINGQTPLHISCEFGRSEVVQCLLQCAASVNESDNFGNTPLHIVGSSGSVECCQILLEYGAAVDFANAAGRTPLDVAINRLTSHHGSAPALGVRKVIAMLSTASPTFNQTSLGGKKGREILMNSTADEEYSLPSESIGEEGFVYGSEDSGSVENRYTREHALRAARRSSDGTSVSSVDSDARIKDLKHRARSNRAEAGGSEGGMSANRRASLRAGRKTRKSSQDSVSSDGSRGRPGKEAQRRSTASADLAYADMKKGEWIERGKLANDRWRIDVGMEQQQQDDISSSENVSYSLQTTRSDHDPRARMTYVPHLDTTTDAEHNTENGEFSTDEGEDAGSTESPILPSTGSVMRNVVWGAASLLGATFKMFAPSSADTTTVAEDTSPPPLHAPPTDAELLRRGLGFHFDANTVPQSPHPPAIVLDDIRAHEAAYRSGRTPRGHAPPAAPDEVVVAVEMARAAERHRRTPQSDRRAAIKDARDQNRERSMVISDAKRPAALTLPGHDDFAAVRAADNAKRNGYSVGPSLPSGVSWRYVDVLNEKK